MSVRKKIIRKSGFTLSLFAVYFISTSVFSAFVPATLQQETIAKQLGWVVDGCYKCGGYFFNQLIPAETSSDNDSVVVTSGGGILSQQGTSLLEPHVVVTRAGQKITTNKAYLYRDPLTGKLAAIDLLGDVHLSESQSLVLAKKGRYDFKTKSKSLIDILYRTSMETNKTKPVTHEVDQSPEPVLTAWGSAYSFSQTEPKIYEFSQASYTTCSPLDPVWQVKASRIVLNKITGRGYATHARILIKNIPVFYAPYINFSIDKQRKTGFLWPTLGGSNQWGPYVLAPFYWNIAPNYDMTITPGILTKRGVQLNDKFRYLTPLSTGFFEFSILPNDRAFQAEQSNAKTNQNYLHPENVENPAQPISVTQAEYNRLIHSNDTRKAFFWHDSTRFNEHWSSHIDFNYVGDDYYLQDFGRTLNELSGNHLLQEGDVYYKDKHWDFTGRLQTYQTLHPIDENPVLNQYRRFPQLILNLNFPDQRYGLSYSMINEVTHFDIRKTPGETDIPPIGNRLHTQPGISLPLYWPGFYVNPRVQLALTDYNLYQTTATHTPNNKRRSVPIFDVASGLMLDRQIDLFKHAFRQTLEPQIYYTYIPYRNQVSIPVFDTTVNTLIYDQLFNYNRFTGIDRIGDANQVSVGMTTRLIDQYSGLEKVRLGVGEIIYFSKRRVTLCNDDSCSDNPSNRSNSQSLSPISGMLNYHINASWSFNADAIWDPIDKQLNNTTLAFQYKPDDKHLLNLAYTYARSGDILSGVSTTSSINNLKVTDISGAWPLFNNISAVGRWSQNWNQEHLQNLLVGLQYDTCCWAVRFVGGRAFIGFNPEKNNKPQYDHGEYIQFTLKGLGDIASGNPSGLLSGITGYKSQFGQGY